MLVVLLNNWHQNSNKNNKPSTTTISIIKFLFVNVIPNSKVPTDDSDENNNKNITKLCKKMNIFEATEIVVII